MRARTWILVVSAAAVIAVLGAVGLAPIASGSREQVFEIPQGHLGATHGRATKLRLCRTTSI